MGAGDSCTRAAALTFDGGSAGGDSHKSNVTAVATTAIATNKTVWLRGVMRAFS